MAVLGSYQDRFLTLYNDNLLMELQQTNSRLMNIFRREVAKGQKNYIDKLGITPTQTKVSRLQKIVWEEENFERRLITFQMKFSPHCVDISDLLDMVSDPTSKILQSMAYSLGRDMDTIIMNAIGGNAVVQANGSVTNTALPSGQKIAVNDITYDPDLSAANYPLTFGKLLKAKKLLDQAYNPGEYVVIAPAGQLAYLLTSTRVASADYRTTKPLESPGTDMGLEGLFGMHFVMYEETGVNGSSDELVYVVGRNAVECLERVPLTTKIETLPDVVGHPQGMHSYFDMGATRMFEESVVQIACSPRK